MESWTLNSNKFSIPQERGRFHPTDAAPNRPKLPLDLDGLRRGLARQSSGVPLPGAPILPDLTEPGTDAVRHR